MSAYVVDRKHIQYLVKAAHAMSRRNRTNFYYYHDGQTHAIQEDDVTENMRLGNMLWQENINSVRARYEGSTIDDMPGPIRETFLFDEQDLTVCFQEFEPAQVLKSCDCYSYQTCEHPGWEASEAHSFICSLIQLAYREVQGYGDAEWGAPEPMEAWINDSQGRTTWTTGRRPYG